MCPSFLLHPQDFGEGFQNCQFKGILHSLIYPMTGSYPNPVATPCGSQLNLVQWVKAQYRFYVAKQVSARYPAPTLTIWAWLNLLALIWSPIVFSMSKSIRALLPHPFQEKDLARRAMVKVKVPITSVCYTIFTSWAVLLRFRQGQLVVGYTRHPV